MTFETYPEIEFEVNMDPGDVITVIKENAERARHVRIVTQYSDSGWQFARLNDTGKVEAKFDVFVLNTVNPCAMRFTAPSKPDSDGLSQSVAAFLNSIFRDTVVLAPNLQKLTGIPGPSEGAAERIATFLQDHGAMSAESIAKSLAMLQYTVRVNLRELQEKGVVGCTPPNVDPRLYFCR